MEEAGRMDCRANRHSIRQVARITTFFSEAFCFFVTSDQTYYGPGSRRSSHDFGVASAGHGAVFRVANPIATCTDCDTDPEVDDELVADAR